MIAKPHEKTKNHWIVHFLKGRILWYVNYVLIKRQNQTKNKKQPRGWEWTIGMQEWEPGRQGTGHCNNNLGDADGLDQCRCSIWSEKWSQFWMYFEGKANRIFCWSGCGIWEKEMQGDTKVLANELFLSRPRCCSFLLVFLLFPAWNTDKGLEVGLEVEQTLGDLQRQAWGK